MTICFRRIAQSFLTLKSGMGEFSEKRANFFGESYCQIRKRVL